MLEQIHFIRPYWLWSLIPLSILLVWLWRHHSDSIWHKVCDAHLLPSLELINFGKYQKRIPLILLSIGWLLAVLTLAGPAWSKLPQPVYQPQHARVLILDLSSTMETQLERAKNKIWDILNQYSQEAQTALVVFADQAYVVSPLTDDANTIAPYVPALKTSLMRVQGKRTWLALQKAGEILKQAGAKRGEVLLITDEVNKSQQNLVEARQLRKQGHHLSILAMGTKVPRFMAAEGHYVELSTHDDSDLNKLLKSTNFNREGKAINPTHEMWQDQGHWLLFLLLPLAALSFRRGWLGVLLLCVIGFPQTSYALSWNDLWQRADQQAAKILAQGVAHYRAGQYEEAAAAFVKVDTAQARYNLGNALVHLREYEDAAKAYRDALKKNPQYAAAKHNLALVEKWLEQRQSKPNRDENPSKSGDKKRSGLSEKESPKDSIKGKGPVKNGQLTIGGKEGQVEGTQEKNNPPEHHAENEQRLEQWLENVDGDLAELLERKFQHQAHEQNR
jgi:Ca-activated chloride channel family protein